MPTETGYIESRIYLRENIIPTPANPQLGTIYVSHTAHQQAKKTNKNTTVSSVSVKFEIYWMNKQFGHTGHIFTLSWINRGGSYTSLGTMNPDQVKTFSLTPDVGYFGVNGFRIEAINLIGLPDVQDEYLVKVTETVNYDIT